MANMQRMMQSDPVSLWNCHCCFYIAFKASLKALVNKPRATGDKADVHLHMQPALLATSCCNLAARPYFNIAIPLLPKLCHREELSNLNPVSCLDSESPRLTSMS